MLTVAGKEPFLLKEKERKRREGKRRGRLVETRAEVR